MMRLLVSNIYAVLLIGLLGACGAEQAQKDQEAPLASAALASSFVQPPGTVAVNFSVDDRANRVYRAGDLKWKGSFLFDETTRILTFDPYWSGSLAWWPTLYDDGPWTRGGHEPIGSKPGDNVWGVTVFVTPSATDSIPFSYGLTDVVYETTLGNGWIWIGPNGTFTVKAGASAAIKAPGMTFEKYGKTDLRLVLDTNHLKQFEGSTWDTWFVGVKSSWWGWGVFPMESMGDGVYALELGELLQAEYLPHTGLLKKGAAAEFVFVLGFGEYKEWGVALPDGVSAEMLCNQGAGFTPRPIEVNSIGNTMVTAPPCGFPPHW